MNKKSILLICGLALALAFFLRERAGRQTPSAIEDSIVEKAAAPVPGAAAPFSVAPAGQAPAAESGAGNESATAEREPPAVFFPKAKVVAKVTEVPQADGRYREFETVETSMKERFVRVERTLKPDASGKLQLLSEVAMVANQILLMKPAGMEQDKFQQVLRQAGAIDVKPVGQAFLATFEARPQDPKALDDYIARVRELAQTEISIEPNYIRKMF